MVGARPAHEEFLGRRGVDLPDRSEPVRMMRIVGSGAAVGATSFVVNVTEYFRQSPVSRFTVVLA